MNNRKLIIAVLIAAVLAAVLWTRLADFGAEIYKAVA